MRGEDDFVAILEKTARLAAGKRQWLRATARDLEQAAIAVRVRRGDGTGAEEVAWPQVAAVRGMVRDELRDRPV